MFFRAADADTAVPGGNSATRWCSKPDAGVVRARRTAKAGMNLTPGYAEDTEA